MDSRLRGNDVVGLGGVIERVDGMEIIATRHITHTIIKNGSVFVCVVKTDGI